ncbi:MAG: hypothetical protein U1F56_05250 [Rubrivivax sp.]
MAPIADGTPPSRAIWPAPAAALGLALAAGTVAFAADRSHIDGSLSGQYSCDENLSPGSRSKSPFSVPIELAVREGRVFGSRDNPQTVDTFSGSIDPLGQLTVELAGSWKDEPSRRWLGRFNGQLRDGAVRAAGEMLAPDGRTRLRTCALTLVWRPAAPSTGSSVSKVPVPPPNPPALGTQAQSPEPSRGTARQGATLPRRSEQALPGPVADRLEAFRRALGAIGQDPTTSKERLADDVADAYRRGNFGNAIENNCSPLDGPYKLEQLGAVLAIRPFRWTSEMAGSVEPLWKEFITSCPGYAQLGDRFLGAVRAATEARARELDVSREAHLRKQAESEAARASEAERARVLRQRQEEVSQRAQVERQRRDAELRQQRYQDLKSGRIKPASLADAELLHDAHRALTLIFSPKVGPSTEYFTVTGILNNVIGEVLVIDVAGRVVEVRLGAGTVFLGARLPDLRLHRPIGMVGTYAGMDSGRGEPWAVFKASYVQQ